MHEGGKVDHLKDPGGRTNRGITQRVYNAWWSKQNLPARDVYFIEDWRSLPSMDSSTEMRCRAMRCRQASVMSFSTAP